MSETDAHVRALVNTAAGAEAQPRRAGAEDGGGPAAALPAAPPQAAGEAGGRRRRRRRGRAGALCRARTRRPEPPRSLRARGSQCARRLRSAAGGLRRGHPRHPQRASRGDRRRPLSRGARQHVQGRGGVAPLPRPRSARGAAHTIARAPPCGFGRRKPTAAPCLVRSAAGKADPHILACRWHAGCRVAV